MEIPQGIYLPLYSSVVLSFQSCHFFYLQLLCYLSELADNIYKIIIIICIYMNDFSIRRNDNLEYNLPFLHCTLNIRIRPFYHPRHHAAFVAKLCTWSLLTKQTQYTCPIVKIYKTIKLLLSTHKCYHYPLVTASLSCKSWSNLYVYIYSCWCCTHHSLIRCLAISTLSANMLI